MAVSEDKPKIALVTSTLFRRVNSDERVRGDLALESAAEAKSLGITVFAVDGGSDSHYKRSMKEHGVLSFPQEGKTMGAARREAIRHAINAGFKVLAYTELEKVRLISEIPKFGKYIHEGMTSLVIPLRQDFSSYPELQRHAEILGNAFWHKLTGLKLDMWFGPKVFGPEVAEYFLSYQGEYGDNWDSIIIPVVRAMAAGERIASVPSSYVHPETQKNIEEGTLEFLKKRLTQLSTLTSAIEIEWRRLKDAYSSTRVVNGGS